MAEKLMRATSRIKTATLKKHDSFDGRRSTDKLTALEDAVAS
jgi:hypothetical protein